MAAFVINPIKKVSSCPCMSKHIYAEKEIVIGTSMALATILLTGHHHHIATLKDVQNTLAYETINTINNIHFDKESLLSRLVKRKKKISIILIFLPFVFRYISFIFTEMLV